MDIPCAACLTGEFALLSARLGLVALATGSEVVGVFGLGYAG